MGIPAQIRDHLSRIVKGRFAVDHPFFLIAGIKQVLIDCWESCLLEAPKISREI